MMVIFEELVLWRGVNIDLKTIDFYYFSGTGNTLLMVKKMKETFERNGVYVTLYPLEKSDPKKINPDHTIGLAFL